MESIINDLVKRRKDPYSVVEKILADELKDPREWEELRSRSAKTCPGKI